MLNYEEKEPDNWENCKLDKNRYSYTQSKINSIVCFSLSSFSMLLASLVEL